MFLNNKYVLYTKDTPLITFRCERDKNNEPLFIEEQSFDKIRPFDYGDINTWISNRRAPKHRTHIKELLKKCGCDDLEGFIRFAYCAGLNDTFWVKPEEMDITWKDISLYRNEFDENIARLAFGTGMLGEKFTSTSPEFVTDGSYPKCWKRFENDIYLLKKGSEGAINAGREPYSELYAYDLSKKICDNALPYELINFHKELVSKCKLFTSEEIGYTPALSFFNKDTTLDEMLAFFDNLGSGSIFRQMIVLDALTLNTDRHLKNFGFLYNNNTMELLEMAPVFDNNLALCPFADIEDLKNIDTYMATRHCSLGEGFNEAAIKCLTPEIKDRLYELRTFEFDNTSSIKLPENRLKLLEAMIHKQTENLLHNRVINIPLNNAKETVLTSMIITIDKDNLPQKVFDSFMQNIYRLNDFSILTEPGDQLRIKDCQYTVNEYDNKIEIDIYDCKTEGNTNTLKAKGIDQLRFMGDVNTSIPAQSIEIQLDKGDFSHVSVLKEQMIMTYNDERTTDNYKENAIENNLLNIDDYQQAPLFRALKELNEKLKDIDTPPISLKVVGGFAMMCNNIRDKSGVTDIDYIGPDLAKEIEQIAEDIGRKHNLGAHWINNDILLSGNTLEDIEFSTGKLHFMPAFKLDKIQIDVLKPEDLLRMKVIAIDTSLTALDFGGEFTRSKDFADVKAIMEQLDVGIKELKEQTESYVFDSRVYEIIDDYLYNGLEGVNWTIEKLQQEEYERRMQKKMGISHEKDEEKRPSMMDKMLNMAMERAAEEKAMTINNADIPLD